jgi:hypothetical protein
MVRWEDLALPEGDAIRVALQAAAPLVIAIMFGAGADSFAIPVLLSLETPGLLAQTPGFTTASRPDSERARSQLITGQAPLLSDLQNRRSAHRSETETF